MLPLKNGKKVAIISKDSVDLMEIKKIDLGKAMNLFDLIVLLIFIISGWIAYKEVFILSLFKLVSRIVSIFLSYKLYPVVSAFLRNVSPFMKQ